MNIILAVADCRFFAAILTWRGDVTVETLYLESRDHTFIFGCFTSHNDSGQVVHTHVLLLSSITIWYWPKGGDAWLQS